MQKLVEAKFSIGNIVKHKYLNFRGVIFDLDPEFVAFHHIIRLLMILFIVPIMLKIISKKT